MLQITVKFKSKLELAKAVLFYIVAKSSIYDIQKKIRLTKQRLADKKC